GRRQGGRQNSFAMPCGPDESSIMVNQGPLESGKVQLAEADKTLEGARNKTQGVEESLASSACVISATNSCTDDRGCHPRTFLALLGVTTQVDGIGRAQEVLFGADVPLPIESEAREGCLRNVSHRVRGPAGED